MTNIESTLTSGLGSDNPLAMPSPLPFELSDFAAITTEHIRETAEAAFRTERGE